jgi:tRNA threonylcarbamoyladenosine biosynthesis protein TsaB
MSEPVALALSGSNLTGDAPFSAALSVAGAVRAAAAPPGARADLAGLVAGLIDDAGLAPADVRRVLVDVGPGSYTGLRVALTFVRFLQRFGAVDVHAVDSLALLAARARHAGVRGRVVAVLDARRDRLHAQAFDVADDRIVAAAPAEALPLAAAVQLAATAARLVAPTALPAGLRAAFDAAGVPALAVERVLAAEMFAAPLPFAAASAADLEPRYLMGSYAEG